MEIPTNTTLTYVVTAETWYWRELSRNTNEKPSINVVLAHKEGGCAWEFLLIEYPYDGGCVKLEMFADAFKAFAMVPEFFTMMRDAQPRTLADVRSILDVMGAVDATQRTKRAAS